MAKKQSDSLFGTAPPPPRPLRAAPGTDTESIADALGSPIQGQREVKGEPVDHSLGAVAPYQPPGQVAVSLEKLQVVARAATEGGEGDLVVSDQLKLTILVRMPENLAPLAASAVELRARTTDLTIMNEEEAAGWNDTLRDIRTHERRFNEARLNITRPIDDLKKQIMAVPAVTLDNYKVSAENIGKAILDLRKRQREQKQKEDEEAARHAAEKAREVRERAAATLEHAGHPQAAEVKRAEPVVLPPTALSNAPVFQPKGVTIKQGFGYAVEDRELLPDEYKMADEKKIKSRVDSFGMQANIPGVLVWPEEEKISGVRGR